MARGSNTGNRALVQGAAKALDEFKYEIAHELGVQGVDSGYWGDVPARQCGAVGGHMVRKMIEMAEQNMASRSTR